MAKMIAPRNADELISQMTIGQLRSAYAANCGCASSCRALTGVDEHGLCAYHERLAGEIKRRMARTPSLRVSYTSAEQDGSCNSCQSREGTLTLIELKNTSFRLCQPCLAELEALIMATRKRK